MGSNHATQMHQVGEELGAGGRTLIIHTDLPPGVPDGFIPKIKVLGGLLPFLPLFAKWKKVSVADFARRFQNPFLRGAFHEALGGEMGLPMLAMLMTLAWLHTGNAGYPNGGSLEFARAMERRYLALGGRITYRARVRKILTENGRAVGVRLEDGSEHRADWVISAVDGHATIFDLLEGKYLDRRFPGVASQVEMVDVATPLTFERKFATSRA